jgi:hypothetical protein
VGQLSWAAPVVDSGWPPGIATSPAQGPPQTTDRIASLISLGVRDVSRAQALCEALGWRLDGGVDDETDHVAFFQIPGMIVALWDRGKLAQDSGVEDSGG